MKRFPTKNTHVTSSSPGPPHFSCASTSHPSSDPDCCVLPRSLFGPQLKSGRSRMKGEPRNPGKGVEEAQSQATCAGETRVCKILCQRSEGDGVKRPGLPGSMQQRRPQMPHPSGPAVWLPAPPPSVTFLPRVAVPFLPHNSQESSLSRPLENETPPVLLP